MRPLTGQLHSRSISHGNMDRGILRTFRGRFAHIALYGACAVSHVSVSTCTLTPTIRRSHRRPQSAGAVVSAWETRFLEPYVAAMRLGINT